MRIRKVDSPKNPTIKILSKLKERRWREKTNLFLVEGERELKRALQCGFTPSTIIVQEGALNYEKLAERLGVQELLIISKSCAEKISIRENPPDIFGVFKYPEIKGLDKAKIGEYSICLCLLWLEKPGNIGAILRSADAFGVDIILISKYTDIFNPHIIRNSTGSVFNLNIFHIDEKECLDFLKNFWIVSADPNARSVVWEIQPKFPIALIIGAEDKGVPENFKKISNQIIRIPMYGKADSLNASVSAALILYEIMKMKITSHRHV